MSIIKKLLITDLIKVIKHVIKRNQIIYQWLTNDLTKNEGKNEYSCFNIYLLIYILSF